MKGIAWIEGKKFLLSGFRGQVAIETIVGVAAVLLVLLLVVVLNSNRSVLVEELDGFYGEANECNEVALVVSLVYSEGPFSRAEFSVSRDINVQDGFVVVGSTICEFVGRAEPAFIGSGDVVARNLTGVVVLESA